MGILSGLKQRLEKGIETTGQKSRQMIEISRLTILIRGKREREKELYHRLGKEVHRLWGEGRNLNLTEDTRRILKDIDEAREDIKGLEAELNALKQAWKDAGGSDSDEKALSSADRGSTGEAPASEPGSVPKSPADTAALPLVEVKEKPNPVSAGTPQPKANGEAEWFSVEQLGDGKAIFICPHCGNQVEEDTEWCPHCGKHIYHE